MGVWFSKLLLFLSSTKEAVKAEGSQASDGQLNAVGPRGSGGLATHVVRALVLRNGVTEIVRCAWAPA